MIYLYTFFGSVGLIILSYIGLAIEDGFENIVRAVERLYALFGDLVRLMDKPSLSPPFVRALQIYAAKPSAVVTAEESETYKKGLEDGMVVLAQIVLEKLKENTNA